MATDEERIKILQMIQEGKINPEQGVQLLETLDEAEKRASKGHPFDAFGGAFPPPGGHAGRWFRVLITDTSSGKKRVNVRLPVGLVSAGMKMGARFAPQVEGLDTDQLMQHLNSGETGQIIDVYNDDENEHIEVFIE